MESFMAWIVLTFLWRRDPRLGISSVRRRGTYQDIKAFLVDNPNLFLVSDPKS
jgi:hypothetical protein